MVDDERIRPMSDCCWLDVLCQNEWTNQNAAWGLTLLGSRNHVFDGGQGRKLPQKPKMGYMSVHNSCGGLIIRVTRAIADSSSALATHTIDMCG